MPLLLDSLALTVGLGVVLVPTPCNSLPTRFEKAVSIAGRYLVLA